MVFTVTLPPPPAALSPNARVHFHKKANVKNAYMAEVVAAVLAVYPRQDWPRLLRARGEVTFRFPDHRRRDVDNLFSGLKSGLDALVRLGILPDDGPANIPEWWLRYRVAPGEPAAVVLRLVDLDGGAMAA